LETSDAYRRIFARYESKTLFQDAATIRKLLDTPTPDAGE
jgi:hypothetical protein